jgi:F0F1-type ATP synthase assembly protein I
MRHLARRGGPCRKWDLVNNSIAAGRKLAVHLVVWQGGIALLLAALFLLRGPRAAAAALFGGAVVALPTAWFALKVLARPASADGRGTLGVFYRAEAVKLILMAFGFWLGTRWFGSTFLPLLLTSMACLAVNWIMLAAAKTH